MKKRYRFVIVLVVMAVCFAFLWPSINWHFLTSREDQSRALQSREQIRQNAGQRAQEDYQRLLGLARENGDVPEDLSFMVGQARRAARDNGRETPERWDALAVLGAFSDRAAVLNAMETRYRDEVFALRNLQKNAVQLGLDLSGGLSIILQADMDALRERLGGTLSDAERDDALERTIVELSNRIDQFGLTEPVIRRQGQDQIYVEIPGNADPGRINDIIMGKGNLTFHIVDDEASNAFMSYYLANPSGTIDPAGNIINPDAVFGTFDEAGNLITRGILDPAKAPYLAIRAEYEQDSYGLTQPVRDANGNMRFWAIYKEVGLDGSHIRSALVSRGDSGPEINLILTNEGGQTFWTFTSANRLKPMAIVLDERVRSVATIQEPLRERFRLSGSFSMDEANNIAMMLRTAGLPVALEVVSQQGIGASMGEDTIRQGLFALLGGIAMVLVFMLVYYRSAGVNAVVAQILNFYIMFSVLSAFSFTLTLPSIAGFILTIGMATDANVIIFERIKEELRLGKSRKAAIDIGFEKAFWAVMDSNVTTFIAALFLAQLGSGPIQGFAVALSVGVFSSVFTALFVSRLIFDFGTDVMRSRKIRITWGRQLAAGAIAGGNR